MIKWSVQQKYTFQLVPTLKKKQVAQITSGWYESE